MSRRHVFRALILAVCATGFVVMPGTAHAQSITSYDFATPIFGLAAAPDGGLFVADAGAGIVKLRGHTGVLQTKLPGVTDVAPIGNGAMWASTSFGDAALWAVSRGRAREVADLGAFEASVNPDQGDIDSNPFDVAALRGGRALIADAAANALLIADRRGHVDWVATLPEELVPTDNVKGLVGCPNPDAADICGLPPMIPAEAVATSVTLGPDGAYYVGELKGFPAPTGESRIWRIEPGTRHAQCGSDPRCSVVADGFTSIIDLTFGHGTFYVTELDEASWFAAEEGLPGALGGTMDACDAATWDCGEVATGLPLPIASAVGKNGTVFAAINALIPGQATVVALD